MPTESQVFQLAWPQFEINANPWDLADLPLPQRQVMRLMLRETQMTGEELSQAVKALPADRRFDDTALRTALQSLVEGQWLVSSREGQTTRYVINLHQKRGGAFAQDIWATLADRNLSAFYTGEGWVTAVTIFALVEMNTQGEGNAGPLSVPADVLERALQATLQADDVTSIVEESARFGLDQLRGNGR
jgi:predicted transcriptional regulator